MNTAQERLNSPMRNLPEDIERIVFEIAASDDGQNALRVLSFVCRRVQRWIYPIAYSTVILSDVRQVTSFAYTILSKGAPFFSSSVRSLCLPDIVWPSEFMILTILTTCSGVTSLYWNLMSELEEYRTSILRALRRLPLHTLYIRITYFLNLDKPFTKPIKFHPNLTCLGILDNWTSWHTLVVGDPQPVIDPSDMARLLYLVLHVGVPPARASLYNDAMRVCKNLKVCLAYVSPFDCESALSFRNRRGLGNCSDARLIVLEMELTRAVWEKQVLDGMGAVKPRPLSLSCCLEAMQ